MRKIALHSCTCLLFLSCVGGAGVVLFFIEAYRSTGDSTYLSDARAGADYLLAFVHKKI